MSNELKKVYQKKLEALLPLITVDDRKEIVEQKIVSRPTLDNYLAGNIVKIDTANTILEFFTKRINRRVDRFNRNAA
jgi:hypothetical protein